MRIAVLSLILTGLATLLPACATVKDAGTVSERQEPTTGSRITRRDRESDVKVMTREESERTRQTSSGTGAPPRN